MKIHKLGALASFMMAVSMLIAPYIYLVGNLRSTFGPLGYMLADFLYGPVWAASLVTAVAALRERLGQRAPRRMLLALLAAFVAAGAFASVAFIRYSNRHYHLLHPELQLEGSTTVLVVWTTLVAGLTATGWHFLGWAMILVGSAGWSSRRLPRIMCVLYWLLGAVSLFVYLLPENEGLAILLGVAISLWQGILLWRDGAREMQENAAVTGQLDQP